MLRREWPLLLQCCSLPRDTQKIASLLSAVRDFDSLFRLADEHSVVAHLATALATVPDAPIPATLLSALRDRHRLQSLFTLTMAAELFRIRDRLDQSGIEFVVVKGPVLSLRAYGDPAARRYVDLDLLIRHDDNLRAAEALVRAGYVSQIPIEAIRAGKIPGEYLFRRPDTNIIFELHTEKTFRYCPLPLPIEKYLQTKTFLQLDGQAIPVLSLEDEFVLICIHGAKHFWERLMWISDVAAMVHRHPELDWKCIQQSAEEVGAARMVRLALLLADRLLHGPVPLPMKDEVARDSVSVRLAEQIETWLPFAGCAAPPVAQRAFFRFRVAGSGVAGARYLTRLSFSPTEEDWSSELDGTSRRFAEILRRPFRLAKKYRRPEP
ncbi:MAG TPA: nucleotidyltransferase family protein [Candidatus Acidoferrum sp.]|jgi:hypothetical protein